MTAVSKPKIALLVESSDVQGGIQSSSNRHIRLMADHYEIIPVAFDNSKIETDWAGRREKIQGPFGISYRVVSADFKSDNEWSKSSSIEFIRHDLRYRAFADQLVEIIQEHGIQLIHAYGQFHQRGMIAAFASARTGVPYILSFRGVDLETRVFDRSVAQIQTSITGAKMVVCVSEDSRRLFQGIFRPSCPVRVVSNHIDPDGFVQNAASPPALADVKVPLIGCFGKFRRVMGMDFLFQGFEALRDRGVPAALLLVGDFQGREAPYYERMISALRHSSDLIRVGFVPHAEVLGYMKRCDLLVYPSVSDASPNKVLEAMVAQVPVISTRTGGIPELVRDGVDGLLVPPRSVEPLADAMESLLKDPERARSLAQNAHQRAIGEFHVRNEKPKWLAIYREAL